MTDSTWPHGVLLVDPQEVVNHDEALRVAKGIADARPIARHYTDPWVIAPAPKRAGEKAGLLIYRVSWNHAWEGYPVALVRKVQEYYLTHDQ